MFMIKPEQLESLRGALTILTDYRRGDRIARNWAATEIEIIIDLVENQPAPPSSSGRLVQPRSVELRPQLGDPVKVEPRP